MVYLESVNAYLHQSSLLLTAYPDSVRITTKYTLTRRTPAPERPTPPSKVTKKNQSERVLKERKRRQEKEAGAPGEQKDGKSKPATLTFKTYQPDSGICLKYSTDKQAEVGRLMLGLGRLAAGENIEEPSAATTQPVTAAEDKIDLDGDEAPAEAKPSPMPTNAQQTGAGGGKKKKKGKK